MNFTDIKLITTKSQNWDYLFVGVGHNGLVCANYLAKKLPKKNFLMLERHHIIGGAALSE